METVHSRVVTPADVDAVVETVTSAFLDDPLWSPMFPDAGRRAEQSAAFWRLSVTSALRYPWTFTTENSESVAIWIPPEGNELTEEEEDALAPFLVELVGRDRADAILSVYDQFEAARPTEPHYYLSLFATHAAHRGQGIGMALLRENLSRIDALGVPAYLESTNPGNNARYAGVGFQSIGDFTTLGGQIVTTMWREPR
jgi:GNAT superfamily N-acetyltransferase